MQVIREGRDLDAIGSLHSFVMGAVWMQQCQCIDNLFTTTFAVSAGVKLP